MRFFIQLILAFFTFMSQSTLALSTNGCSQKDAIQAETEASSLRDWDSLYSSYQKFVFCDDGAISEGYSESITWLMVEDWKNIIILQRLIERDKRFLKFIIAHIDETVPADRLYLILENSKIACPRQAMNLCQLIEQEIAFLLQR